MIKCVDRGLFTCLSRDGKPSLKDFETWKEWKK